MASSLSLDPSNHKFDVFVSFRGKDTRNTFIYHLLEFLKRRGINALTDVKLEPGYGLSIPFERIEQSKISIVVFSKHYADSIWCLNELLKIIQCKETLNQKVIPIFYKVKKSDVENQTGSFGAPFLRHEKRFKEDFHRVEAWKNALRTASNIDGFELLWNSSEREFIVTIARETFRMLNVLSPWEIRGLPGIESRSKELEELLRFDDANCVRTIGVLGKNGIGKTTVADNVYRRNYGQFDGFCFLGDIGNDSKRYGLEHMRQKLLCKLLDSKNVDVGGRVRWEDSLMTKKLFIVLDNVTEENQINELIWEQELYRKGSRIVITTRDEKLLQNTDATYLVPRLNDQEVMELLDLDAYSDDFRPTEEVMNTNNDVYLNNSENVVRILELLNHSQPSDAEIVGIWGMAGIGKTSIAKEVFDILAPQYDLSYFLPDFYVMCQKKGLRQMRDDFYSSMFVEKKLSISACDIKPSFMRDWFHKKKILVVLDDVSYSRDAEAVVGGFGWFSRGHRIILTSRRKQVLIQCRVEAPYEMQKLCVTESFSLCRKYLNARSKVISELMSCSSGIPLALKVLGSSASKKPINNMLVHLQRLRRNPPTQMQETFRRSFDGLDENEKNIFLDLACFFGGENKDHVVELLDACGFLTYLGICSLIDESLISLLKNMIEIPIPFQDIGRFIVHEEDEDPCERSRLWDSKDITDVLTKNSGTEAIEGIFLEASDLTHELSPTVFSKMYRLRLLKFYCSISGNECKLRLPQGLDTLPAELRLLHWENYPLKHLPQKFNPENLVEVNMPCSNIEKLWERKKNLEKLKIIKLSHSCKLTDITILSEAFNLEHIDLEGCTSLVDISIFIPRCRKLVSLNMKDCSRLQSLPAMVDLKYLELLNLSGCSELEEIQDFAPNLRELYLAGTAIEELPSSIEKLTKLGTLDLENCIRLKNLPYGIQTTQSILKLKLSGCTNLGSPKRKRSVGNTVGLRLKQKKRPLIFFSENEIGDSYERYDSGDERSDSDDF